MPTYHNSWSDCIASSIGRCSIDEAPKTDISCSCRCFSLFFLVLPQIEQRKRLAKRASQGLVNFLNVVGHPFLLYLTHLFRTTLNRSFPTTTFLCFFSLLFSFLFFLSTPLCFF